MSIFADFDHFCRFLLFLAILGILRLWEYQLVQFCNSCDVLICWCWLCVCVCVFVCWGRVGWSESLSGIIRRGQHPPTFQLCHRAISDIFHSESAKIWYLSQWICKNMTFVLFPAVFWQWHTAHGHCKMPTYEWSHQDSRDKVCACCGIRTPKKKRMNESEAKLVEKYCKPNFDTTFTLREQPAGLCSTCSHSLDSFYKVE